MVTVLPSLKQLFLNPTTGMTSCLAEEAWLTASKKGRVEAETQNAPTRQRSARSFTWSWRLVGCVPHLWKRSLRAEGLKVALFSMGWHVWEWIRPLGGGEPVDCVGTPLTLDVHEDLVVGSPLVLGK
jgi:hypothetical protein